MSPRERYIAIGVGVVLALAILDYFFLEPLLTSYNDATTLIDKHTTELASMKGTQDNSKNASKRWARLTSQNQLAPDSSTAEVTLLNRVRDAAQSAGVQIGQQGRTQVLKQGGFDTVTRPITVEGNMAEVSSFLFNLDQSTIPLRVVDLTMTSNKDGLDDLSMSFSVATLYDPPDNSAAKAIDGGVNR